MNTPEQRSAYINAQVACAMIEAMGMQAQNDHWKETGGTHRFLANDFENLISKYGIDHNSTIGYLRDV